MRYLKVIFNIPLLALQLGEDSKKHHAEGKGGGYTDLMDALDLFKHYNGDLMDESDLNDKYHTGKEWRLVFVQRSRGEHDQVYIREYTRQTILDEIWEYLRTMADVAADRINDEEREILADLRVSIERNFGDGSLVFQVEMPDDPEGKPSQELVIADADLPKTKGGGK